MLENCILVVVVVVSLKIIKMGNPFQATILVLFRETLKVLFLDVI